MNTPTRPRTIWARLFVTLVVIVAYRLGAWIPLPGIDPEQLRQLFQAFQDLGASRDIEHLSIFALGLIPYLNAALLFSVIAFRSVKLRELFLSQERTFSWGFFALILLFSVLQAAGTGVILVSQRLTSWEPWAFYLINIPVLVAGVFVLIWLGDLINRYGVGNGWAILIVTRILIDWPRYIVQISSELQVQTVSWAWGLGLAALFVLVLVGSFWAFSSSYRVEMGERTLIFPFVIAGIIPLQWGAFLLVPVSLGLFSPEWLQALSADFAQGWGYIVSYGIVILLLTYFYKDAIVHPEELGGRRVPALGTALFLFVLALLPLVVTKLSGFTAYSLGGIGVLIVAGVLADAYHQAHLALPTINIYRTFSHARAHEITSQLAAAGIPSVLRTILPYPYTVFPILGPLEVVVSQGDQLRAQELVRNVGPEPSLKVPPHEGFLWLGLATLAVLLPAVLIWSQLSAWPLTPTTLAVVLAGIGAFWWLRTEYRQYAYWFLIVILLLASGLYSALYSYGWGG